MDKRIVAAATLLVLALITLNQFGFFEPKTEVLVAKHGGFFLAVTPIEGMTAEQLAHDIHGGVYGDFDNASKGFEVSTYIIYEDWEAIAHDNIKNVVAKGGHARIAYSSGYSPIDWDEDEGELYQKGTVTNVIMGNITIERL